MAGSTRRSARAARSHSWSFRGPDGAQDDTRTARIIPIIDTTILTVIAVWIAADLLWKLHVK